MISTSHKIPTQVLGVSHRDMGMGHGLVYAPAPVLQDGPVPEPHWQPIRPDILRQQLDAIRGQIEELIGRARRGGMRDDCGIESWADSLAAHVLPKRGLLSILEPGVHPQFDTVFDVASEILWEVLEERYAVCECQPQSVLLRRGERGGSTLHCPACGRPMKDVGGRLAIDRHLTHLVRGGRVPSGEGDEFLIIADPAENLCASKADPRQQCARNLEELTTLLDQHGYKVNVIQGKNATVRCVSTALGNPGVMGLYYFGPGMFPRDAEQGCLLLADGPLHASEIEALAPEIRLVFLNACEDAAAGQTWTLERKFGSVAHAFARSGAVETCIAPLWPVVGVQAAQAALEFFRQAIAGECLGNALRAVRLQSLRQYEQGQPDISWMAYRYFGDPNRMLPAPRQTSPASVNVAKRFSFRVFAADGRLDAELFGFDLRGVLLRAAKRRNLQKRALATTTDFLAGLIRTGHLTRFALRQQNLDPDHVYAQIVQEKEHGAVAGATPAASHDDDAPHHAKGNDRDCSSQLAAVRQALAQWVINEVAQFDENLLAVLRRADHIAQSRQGKGQDQRISEHDLLDAMTAGNRWAVRLTTQLPAPSLLRQWLARREAEQVVDANGQLLLTSLSAPARRIVEAAHELSQQRGQSAIPNRLMLAAFLMQGEGFTAMLGGQCQVDAKALALLLIASTEGKSPETFVLSPEAAEQVVLPLLRRGAALRDVEQQTEITAAMLFRAYCDLAPPKFKAMLAALPDSVRIDLDELRAAAEKLPPPAAQDGPPRSDATTAWPSEKPAVVSPPAPYDGTEHFIFVSYKREDIPRITLFLHRLVEWGYKFWYDRGIPGGAEWDALIEEKISQCGIFLVFLSEAAVQSKWVRREIKFADSENRPILGIRLDKNLELKHGLKVVMNQYQMIDASDTDFSEELRKAIEYVRLL